MTLRVVHRSYGGENAKGRPRWYSKTLALYSLVRAAEAAGAAMVFLNNGPIPAHLVEIMRGAGEIVDLPGISMKRSFRAALALPGQRGWADDDVVYFCEDDYLHTPQSLVHLREVTRQVPADYYALYARHVLVDTEHAGRWSWIGPGEADPPEREPAGWRAGEPVTVEGHTWIRMMATTATFAGRVRAVREDAGIVTLAGLPHRRMFRDREIGLVAQGYRPNRWSALLRDAALLGGDGSARGRVRAAVHAPFKVATNLRSLRRPARRRVLMGATPCLAAHLEIGALPLGRDWDAVAADTAAWVAARTGVPLHIPPAREACTTRPAVSGGPPSPSG